MLFSWIFIFSASSNYFDMRGSQCRGKVRTISKNPKVLGCLPTCVRVQTSLLSDLQMEAFTFYRLLTLTAWQFQWSKKITDQLPIIVGGGSSVGWGVRGYWRQAANQLWMGQERLCLRNGQRQKYELGGSCLKTGTIPIELNYVLGPTMLAWDVFCFNSGNKC